MGQIEIQPGAAFRNKNILISLSEHDDYFLDDIQVEYKLTCLPEGNQPA